MDDSTETSTSNLSSPLALSSSQEFQSTCNSHSPSDSVGRLNFKDENRSSGRNSTRMERSGGVSLRPDRKEKGRIGSVSRRDREKQAMATLQTLSLGDSPSRTASNDDSNSKSTRVTRAQILELAAQGLLDRNEEANGLRNMLRRERAERLEEKMQWKSDLEKVLGENQKMRAQLALFGLGPGD